MLNELDKDGNASLDFEEFLELMSGKEGKDEKDTKEEIDKIFRLFDTDGKGVATVKDVLLLSLLIGQPQN